MFRRNRLSLKVSDQLDILNSLFENRIQTSSSSIRFADRRWLTTKEVALYLGRTAGAIRNLVYRGKLLPKKHLGRLLFDRHAIDRSIEFSR